MTDCGGGNGADEVQTLPSNPFRGLHFHFGQLLGVQDFQDEQGYHRGKNRLHNGWLHGAGVVWGLGVSLPEDGEGALRGEVEVAPGLALDRAGNELHLGRAMCLDLGRWFEEHRDDPGFDFDEDEVEDGGVEVRFVARVVARFRACLSRPVPAMSEPCEGARADTAYSRTLETVELHLRPGSAPPRPAPYRRLRLLFGLVAPRDEEGGVIPEDQEVLDARAAVASAPAEERPRALLAALRRFAALDGIALEPDGGGDAPSLVYPVEGRPPLLLAEVADVRLVRGAEGGPWRLVEAVVDNTVRMAHVATSTIQELLCGPAPDTGAAEGAAEPPGDPEVREGEGGGADTAAEGAGAEPDAGGPRIAPDSVELDGDELTFRVVGSLSKNSIEDPRAVAVRGFDRADGWQEVPVREVAYDRGRDRVRVRLQDAPDARLVRLIVRGTGEHPVLGTDMVPLAGAVGGPPGSRHDGNDFVFMFSQGS
jgi:hypothetical protein